MTDDAREPAAAGGFRTCGAYGRRWATLQAFQGDPGLTLIGLQVAEHRPESNLIVADHGCGTSVSVLTGRLRASTSDGDASGDLPDRNGTEEYRRLCRRLDE